MISGGNATVYVANMDAAVQFYTETLGLTLTNRFGNHWATLESAPGYWSEKRGRPDHRPPSRVAAASRAGHSWRSRLRPGNV